MKKLLLLVFIIVGQTICNGQAKKNIFLEHFTNSNCGSCAASNPNFFGVIANYEGKYHHISFHPIFPYSSCVFYQANKTENTDRTSFYSIAGTPTVVINGLTKKSASQVKNTTMDAELGKTSPIEVIVKETGTNNRTVNIEVKTVGVKPNGDYKVYAAIAEKIRNQTTGNGEKVHHNVFRKFLTSSAGDNINLAETGNLTTLSFNYSVNSGWVESETYVLVWIQDVATKEILNSGSKFDIVLSTNNLYSSDIKVTSNPVRSDLDVQFSKPLEGSYFILNLMGQVIERGNLNPNSQNLSLPVSNYKSGMYFIRIESNNQKITKRWIKESFNP